MIWCRLLHIIMRRIRSSTSCCRPRREFLLSPPIRRHTTHRVSLLHATVPARPGPAWHGPGLMAHVERTRYIARRRIYLALETVAEIARLFARSIFIGHVYAERCFTS